jgi:hypothetical protein
MTTADKIKTALKELDAELVGAWLNPSIEPPSLNELEQEISQILMNHIDGKTVCANSEVL